MSNENNLKKRRKELGLTQKELGEKLGVSQQTIGQFEHNLKTMRPDTLERVAEALDTTPMYLLGWLSNPNDRVSIIDDLAFQKMKKDKALTSPESSNYAPDRSAYMNTVTAALDDPELEDKFLEKLLGEHNDEDDLTTYNINDEEGVNTLIKSYSQLNSAGQKEAVKRVEELTYIPEYKKKFND